MMRVRRGGFDPFAQFRDVDRQLGDFISQGLPGLADRVLGTRPFPAVNLWDAGEELIAEAELPGLKNEDLDIAVLANELTIKGERKSGSDESISYHQRERALGPFSRSVKLPVEVDADRVSATLTDGVLTIRLPKAEAAKARKINVQGS